MEWLALAFVAVVTWFVWHGFRTRCPKCGVMALHLHDKVAEKEQAETFRMMQSIGILKSLDDAGSSLGSSRSKPGYANALFRCKVCGHSFQRSTAVLWLTISNKVGEERALAEYSKLLSEHV